MDHELPDQDVGSALPVRAIVASVVALVVIVGGFVAYRTVRSEEARHEIVIAGGPDTGTYHAFGVALARVLEYERIVKNAEVLTTEGSVANMELIDRALGGADLAFVQSDTHASSRARLIAPLYDEVLHILVATAISDEVTIDRRPPGTASCVGRAGFGNEAAR